MHYLALNILSCQQNIQCIFNRLHKVAKAIEVLEFLYKRGILIPTIRTPTVPTKSSRLRMTVMSTYTLCDLDKLLDVLRTVLYPK